jgi:hypothetical protein
MDHLSGSGDALPIGEFFQLGLGQVNNFLEAKMRATIINEGKTRITM